MTKNNSKNREKARKEKIAKFNPNENGLRDHGIFGLPFLPAESEAVLVPIPWEATVSYKTGASKGPEAILNASQQIDLYDPILPDGWRMGIAMQEIPADIFYKNKQVREKAEKYLGEYSDGRVNKDLQKYINKECLLLKESIKENTAKLLDEGKIAGVVGGDHSVPLGYLEALSEKYKSFGILHIDAHCDLRNAYEGLKYSHASIFFNALKIKNISQLTQIGVRDCCEAEIKFAEANKNRVTIFTDYEIKKSIFNGSSWAKVCDKIIKTLPDNVYISFDIDGLLPYLCPNTGTPMPGGFSIEEMTFLFEKLIASKKKIIGFDLCEVAPGKEGEWDGNVGARILYKLCLLAIKSQK
ncbi:MAG TPA: agmatinase family protein [Candidatus Paceibacterota bacterium]|nr:agmatinase family protein [Candidatus Paceibacterota bacterium]